MLLNQFFLDCTNQNARKEEEWGPSTELEWDMMKKKGRESRNLCQGRYYVIPSYRYQGGVLTQGIRDTNAGMREGDSKRLLMHPATLKSEREDDNIMHVLAHTHTHNRVYPCEISRMTSSSSKQQDSINLFPKAYLDAESSGSGSGHFLIHLPLAYHVLNQSRL